MGERTGTRDLSYSRWHRTLPPHFCFQDIDGLEYCGRCNEPILIVSLATDHGQRHKETVREYKLAKRAGIVAVHLFVQLGTQIEDATYQGAVYEVTGFRRRWLYPDRGELGHITPAQWETEIQQIRNKHQCAT